MSRAGALLLSAALAACGTGAAEQAGVDAGLSKDGSLSSDASASSDASDHADAAMRPDAAGAPDAAVRPDAGSIPGRTWYVAPPPAGSDAADGRSASTPFATLSKANSVARPGDTVLVRGGTYNVAVSFSTSGTSSAPITWQAYPGETPVIDGSGDKYVGEDGLVYLTGSWLVFRGFEVRNAGSSARHLNSVFVTGKHVTVESCHIHHGTAVGVRGWLESAGLYLTVQDCHIHDMDDQNGGGADGVAISGWYTGQQVEYGDPIAGNCVLRRNLIHHCTDDGIDVWHTPGNLIERNVVHSNGLPGWWSDVGQDGNGVKFGADGSGGPGGHNVVRYNVSFSNRRRGFDTNGGSGDLVYGNTAYGNGLAGIQATTLSAGATGTNAFYNNVSLSNAQPFSSSAGSGSVVESHNTWNLSIGDCGFATTTPPAGATSVADFAASDFLHLSATTCVDRGVSVPGQADPPDGQPDLGAYEAP